MIRTTPVRFITFSHAEVKDLDMINRIPETVPVKERKKRSTYDYGLLVLTLLFVALGLIFIYSTSAYTASKKFSNPEFYFRRQSIYAVLGIVTMIVVSMIDYRFYYKKFKILFLKIRPVYFLYALSLFLLVLVLVVGEEIYGAKRWLEIPKIGSFQPSELAKICVILFTAFIAYANSKRMSTFKGFLIAFVYIGPLIVLTAKEDLSTAIVMAGIFFIICFVASKKTWYFVLTGLCAAGAVVLYILYGEEFRSTRVTAWLNVDTDAAAYQIRRGLYAIASGGIFGKGLGESTLKLGYVPEAHNDMIFTIICEELGLFGACVIIGLYVLLLYGIYKVGREARDMYGSFICVGVMAHISLQVIINIAVVTNTIPATGLALPFISYGGTSLVLLLCEMGLVLAVSKYSKDVE